MFANAIPLIKMMTIGEGYNVKMKGKKEYIFASQTIT
jgi:hypothetical protein